MLSASDMIDSPDDDATLLRFENIRGGRSNGSLPVDADLLGGVVGARRYRTIDPWVPRDGGNADVCGPNPSPSVVMTPSEEGPAEAEAFLNEPRDAGRELEALRGIDAVEDGCEALPSGDAVAGVKLPALALLPTRWASMYSCDDCCCWAKPVVPEGDDSSRLSSRGFGVGIPEYWRCCMLGLRGLGFGNRAGVNSAYCDSLLSSSPVVDVARWEGVGGEWRCVDIGKKAKG